MQLRAVRLRDQFVSRSLRLLGGASGSRGANRYGRSNRCLGGDRDAAIAKWEAPYIAAGPH